MKVILNEKDIKKIISNLVKKIIKKYKNLNKFGIIGIHTNGVYLAKRIAEKIEKSKKKKIDIGFLDITFYRDDIGYRQNIQSPKETEINFDLNNKDILLVDDVIYTGRTIRAAIEQILEIGRPKSISVAVLIDRGLRELPIYAEFVGKKIKTKPNQQVEILLREANLEGDKVIIYSK
ncbi:MAG: bifunctional pyr operon transcriptional regulator/uracil phosphoribosyltransferase PyrR [Elusimicrobiota bacterium]|nr:bifunctional pyr operon transcriptional regulator/uracil phosphoribosyltransferase PyrR [Endomicrobiia bacterium]MCX7910423.1 bifunctional pyr operon transcriptional regulator/uracil phosphoribosyltransferase PyrR [Endomicrobiia bacterium]MDW8165884.1 bifunctional pyr operon transcriptional regulator/uracil phosphoribosyltransferase PyrR [Elusimicrobiota bacterium]